MIPPGTPAPANQANSLSLQCYHITFHCTALHCTALHCTALHCTALHCTALHCTAQHSTAQHSTLPPAKADLGELDPSHPSSSHRGDRHREESAAGDLGLPLLDLLDQEDVHHREEETSFEAEESAIGHPVGKTMIIMISLNPGDLSLSPLRSFSTQSLVLRILCWPGMEVSSHQPL